MRKRRVVGRVHGMKYRWKGHKSRNRHKNRVERSGQARLVYVKNINCNIPTTWRWARGDYADTTKSDTSISWFLPWHQYSLKPFLLWQVNKTTLSRYSSKHTVITGICRVADSVGSWRTRHTDRFDFPFTTAPRRFQRLSDCMPRSAHRKIGLFAPVQSSPTEWSPFGACAVTPQWSYCFASLWIDDACVQVCLWLISY